MIGNAICVPVGGKEQNTQEDVVRGTTFPVPVVGFRLGVPNRNAAASFIADRQPEMVDLQPC